MSMASAARCFLTLKIGGRVWPLLRGVQSSCKALEMIVHPDLHIHNVQAVAVVVLARVDKEVYDVARPQVQLPLDLLPVG